MRRPGPPSPRRIVGSSSMRFSSSGRLLAQREGAEVARVRVRDEIAEPRADARHAGGELSRSAPRRSRTRAARPRRRPAGRRRTAAPRTNDAPCLARGRSSSRSSNAAPVCGPRSTCSWSSKRPQAITFVWNMRLRPTSPLEFARPFGCARDVDRSSSRVWYGAPFAITTVRAVTSRLPRGPS